MTKTYSLVTINGMQLQTLSKPSVNPQLLCYPLGGYFIRRFFEDSEGIGEQLDLRVGTLVIVKVD